MTRRLVLVLALALALVACGDDDAADTTTADTTAATTAATTPATSADTTTATSADTTTADDSGAAGATITIEGFSFGDPVTSAVGETVTVTNADGATHTWTARDGTFDSGNLGGGDSFEFTFDTAGTYEFFCQIHSSMTGSITVG